MFRLVLFSVAMVTLMSDVRAMESRHKADITQLLELMADVHPGYGRYTSQAVRNSRDSRLKNIADSDISDLKLYSELARYLASYRCDHTLAELSESLKAQKEQRFSPFQFQIFNNKFYVSAGNAPLNIGDEIISINGHSSADIITKLTPYISRDGHTDHVIQAKIAFDGDVYGSYFEVLFAPVVLGLDSFPKELNLQVKSHRTGKTQSLTMDVINFKSWRALSDRIYRMNFKDAVSYQIKGNVAILRVDTFVNYRQPVDAMALFEQVFNELNTKNINRLIVDLRRNGGGSDDAQLALLRHLISEPIQINNAAWYRGDGVVKWKSKLSSWEQGLFNADPESFPKEAYGHRLPNQLLGSNYQSALPAEARFKGEVIMLTSVNNASGSAGALGILQEQKHITLIGEQTGGNLGGTTATLIAFHKLAQSGITVRVPLIRNQYNTNRMMDGIGVKPDVLVTNQLPQWLAGRDMILEKAMSY